MEQSCLPPHVSELSRQSVFYDADCQCCKLSFTFLLLSRGCTCDFIFQGVKIFDITSKQRITNVPRDDVSLRPDMYPCSLCWKDNVTLIIGWGTSVKVIWLVLYPQSAWLGIHRMGPRNMNS